MNLYWMIGVGVIAAATGFGLGHRAASNACAAKELAAVKVAQQKYDELELRYNSASALLEGALEAHRSANAEVTRTINTIVDRPIYGAACLDSDGLRIANNALRGTTSTTQPAGKVPAVVGTH